MQEIIIGGKMTKKEKSFWNTFLGELLTTYGWAILLIIISLSVLVYFGVLNPHNLMPEPLKTNSWCGDNPDKCVCEDKFICKGLWIDAPKEYIDKCRVKMDCDNINFIEEKSFGKCYYYKDNRPQENPKEYCFKFRKKTQAEVDIEDCQNSPREDDLCKCVLKIGCEHWLQLLNYDCSDWNIFNCSYWKEDVTLGYNYCINFISECVKSHPKTECEKKSYYRKSNDEQYYFYFCKGIDSPATSLTNRLLTPEELKSNIDCDVEYKIINPDWVEEKKRYVECDNGFKGFIENNRINVATEQGNPTTCDEYQKTICREKQ